MKFVLITQNAEIAAAAREGFHPTDRCEVFSDWNEGLAACKGVQLLFVDLLATLVEPNKIAGYEIFALAKMQHKIARDTPLVLISPPKNYDLDFMVGWPDFIFGHIASPVDYRIFRRASTWV